MNTIDFLSSDIEFPCDSNEPKLSANPCTKLPEPVDWSFHDYYSTVLEKAFAPIHSVTDIHHLEPVKDTIAPPNYLKDWKNTSVLEVHDKQDDQAVVLVLSNTIQSAPPPPRQQHSAPQQNNLRLALRGALDLVENDMQKNMHDALCSPSQSTNQNRSPFGNSSIFNKDHYLTWKDDILAETLHIGSLDQDLWDDDDDNIIIQGDASPAYHKIDENPIVDSSLPSRISSIMPLSSSQATSQPLPQKNIRTPMILAPSSSSSKPLKPSSPAQSSAKENKHNSWNMWTKVKQAAHPFIKQFKTPSSKNAFKRLFQH
ncbi:hypothetical protein BCR42DRAFT_406635 [Absidia repens]|uniref:Uncharacterized protein n=1 Tax=Absidia repens TaxID=90262 RepID=A0A1X2IV02_9FUNG|nr:hypothetical protein BCR42DRAFT_406635 [Absidia repens]